MLETLASQGYCVKDGFLDEALVGAVREDLRAQRALGMFRRAGVGRGSAHQIADEIRRDEICWLDLVGATGARAELAARLEALRLAMNRELYLGLRDFEGHYAVYPPGAFYRRHRDRFADDSDRVASCLIYLNEAWSETDGGALRLFGRAPDEAPLAEILPEAGRLVVFLSDELPHEVLPTRRERLSVTGWFLRDRRG